MNKKYIVDGVYANQSNSFFSIFKDVDLDQCIDGYLDGFGSLFVSKESNVNLSESDERRRLIAINKGTWIFRSQGFKWTEVKGKPEVDINPKCTVDLSRATNVTRFRYRDAMRFLDYFDDDYLFFYWVDNDGDIFIFLDDVDNISSSDTRAELLGSGKGIWLFKRDGFSITDKSKFYKLINDTSGLKHDQGKDMPYLLFQGCPKAVKGVSEVLTYGANKYEPNSWQNVDIDRYWNALYRHLGALHSGETHDSESGLPHIDHIATNIMFISEKLKKGE